MAAIIPFDLLKRLFGKSKPTNIQTIEEAEKLGSSENENAAKAKGEDDLSENQKALETGNDAGTEGASEAKREGDLSENQNALEIGNLAGTEGASEAKGEGDLSENQNALEIGNLAGTEGVAEYRLEGDLFGIQKAPKMWTPQKNTGGVTEAQGEHDLAEKEKTPECWTLVNSQDAADAKAEPDLAETQNGVSIGIVGSTGNAAEAEAEGDLSGNQKAPKVWTPENSGAKREPDLAENEKVPNCWILTNTQHAADANGEQNLAQNENARNIWTLSRFDVGRRLGCGQFGSVYKAQEKESKRIIALKMLSKEQILQANCQHQICRELEIQTGIMHPHILPMHGFFHDEKRIYLMLEYAPGGSLFKKLEAQPERRFSESQAAIYIRSVALALDYLHEHDVIHRDIKPENLLLGHRGELKLADFGLAVHSPAAMCTTQCGTADYMAPEIVEAKPYYRSVDLWSLGVLCYELVVGRTPFAAADKIETFTKIKKLDYKLPAHVSLAAAHLLSRLLVLDPDRRIPPIQVHIHPWILCLPREIENN